MSSQTAEGGDFALSFEAGELSRSPHGDATTRHPTSPLVPQCATSAPSRALRELTEGANFAEELVEAGQPMDSWTWIHDHNTKGAVAKIAGAARAVADNVPPALRTLPARIGHEQIALRM